MNTLCTQQTGALNSSANDNELVIQTRSNAEQPIQDCVKGIQRQISHTPLAKLIRKLDRWMIKRYEQRIDRQAFQQLHKLDDHMLKDIGVTRYDVKWASRLPLSEDAAAELEIIARRR